MNILTKLLVCLIASAGAGIGTGFAGMSAAAIIGPMLSTFCGMTAYQALGIGLISDVLASGISAWVYHKHGNLDIKNSLPLLVSVLCMTVVGSLVGSLVPNRSMGGMQQLGLLLVGLKFLIKPQKTTKEQMKNEDAKHRFIKAVGGGIIVGFICGFIGAGGGMMLLLVLTSFLNYEMHIAVGTSVFIMMFTALTGGVSHIIIGGVPDLFCLITCVIFTLLFARVASKIANKVDAVKLSRVVGVTMVAFSAIIIIVNYVF